MGGQRGGAVARRPGLHAGGRGRAAVPPHAHPRHRRRHQRDHAAAGRKTAGVLGMTVLTSKVDTRSDEFAANRDAMLAKLDELAAEHAKAVAGGGEKYVERHRKRGKLLARERIELLLDEDSPFMELSPLAAWGSDFTVGGS